MKLKAKLASVLVGCSLLLASEAAYSFCVTLTCSDWVGAEKRLSVFKCGCQHGDETVFTQLPQANATWYRGYNCNPFCR